jgi:hypothetical protein
LVGGEVDDQIDIGGQAIHPVQEHREAAHQYVPHLRIVETLQDTEEIRRHGAF